ncbi:hypothetical protein ACQ4PT_052475 [Festuca glaucescens]
MGDALPPPAEWRDWAALHSNALCAILSKIPQADILRGAGAGLACKLWRRIAVEEDLLWRRIELAAAEDTDPDGPAGWQVMARAAVDRSAGRCESYRGRADAEFLMYDVSRRQIAVTEEPPRDELVLHGGRHGGQMEDNKFITLIKKLPLC